MKNSTGLPSTGFCASSDSDVSLASIRDSWLFPSSIFSWTDKSLVKTKEEASELQKPYTQSQKEVGNNKYVMYDKSHNKESEGAGEEGAGWGWVERWRIAERPQRKEETVKMALQFHLCLRQRGLRGPKGKEKL